MQRYEFVIGDLAPAGQLVPSDNGEWVKYADTLPRTLNADDPEPAVGTCGVCDYCVADAAADADDLAAEIDREVGR
jgi:hypothetical protein